MPNIDLLAIVPIIGFGAFLWVGLYVITRASVQTPLTIVTCLGMVGQAAYFFFAVLNNEAAEGRDIGVIISRSSWWCNCIPVAIWFHISSLVVRRGKPYRVFTTANIIFYTLALVITVSGTFTDLFLDYAGAGVYANQHTYVGVGSLYEYYMVFLAVTGFAAFLNFFRFYLRLSKNKETASPAIIMQVALLSIGAVLFVAGGLYLSIKFKWVLSIQEYPAYIALIIGLGLFGYAIAHYDMLLEGKAIGRDFAYSFISVLIMNIFYAALLGVVGLRSLIATTMLVAVVTVNNTLYDWGRSLLDKFFFSKDEQNARLEARDYASALATQPVSLPQMEIVPPETPVAPDELPAVTAEQPNPAPENHKTFNDAVRRSISHLKNPPQLVKSPLLSMRLLEKRLGQSGQEDNRLNRAAALKTLLTEMIERLRPDDNAHFGSTDAWRYYNVLYFPYVREVSKKNSYTEARRLADERRKAGVREPGEIEKALEWLSDVDEDTFYKWQRRASDTIADILREEENNLSGSAIGQEGARVVAD